MDYDRLFEPCALVTEYLGNVQTIGEVKDKLLAAPTDIKLAAINAHPALGEPSHACSQHEQRNLSTDVRNACEQYRSHFGFQFVTFVNSRGTEAIVEEISQRLKNDCEEEIQTAIGHLCAIARSRE